jgi:hypothetical protein
VLLLLLPPGIARAASIDPSFRFRTLETEHFSVHFHQGLGPLAEKTAAIAERVRDRLEREFLWTPAEKTQVVLVDESDFANGYAISLPYNALYLLTVPPSQDSTVGEYEDWLEVLFVHEYVHVLTSDPSRGYSEITRKIFGKPVPSDNPFSLLAFLFTAPPNVFLPRWWQEGTATWAETEYTAGGRGRSTTFEMILRMAVEEENLPTIDRINEDLPDWPDGHYPYLYGYRLAAFIAKRHGKEAPGILSKAHAGRPPYLINGAAEQQGGGNYKELFLEMIEDLKAEQKERIGKLAEVPFTPRRVLPAGGESLTHPRYSPDGAHIAFHRRDPHDHETIVVADADGSRPREVARRLPSDRAVTWSPDGGMIYFCQAEVTDYLKVYQDLYGHDLRTGKTRRLTKGMRLREADLSPDGRTFAAVQSGAGSQNLVLLLPGDGPQDADEVSLRLSRATDHRFTRVSSPRWSPDGSRIAYIVRSNDGRSGIHLYEPAAKTVRILFESADSLADPAWSGDGKYLLYVSDPTGVFNLFAYSFEEKRSFQVTHLLGGAFHADVSRDNRMIVFSEYHSRGYRLAAMEFSPDAWRDVRGSSIIPPRKEKTAPRDDVPPASERKTPSPADAPYKAWGTLAPRFWLPVLSGDHEGVAAGAFTAGRDVLGYHAYLAELSYGPGSGRVYYFASYLYDRFAPGFAVQAYSQPVLYSDLHRKGDYYERNESLVLSVSYPVYYLESSWRFTLGFHRQDVKALSELAGGAFEGLPVFQGRRDNIFASASYTCALRYPHSVSREEGRSFTLAYRNYSKRRGSDLTSQEYVGSYEEFIGLPSDRLKHHVLLLALKGGISTGTRTVQQAFQIGGPPSLLTGFPLRGYPSRFETGKYAATGTLEYRVPIRNIYRGPGTFPLFLDRVHGAVFTDFGEAWGNATSFSLRRMKVGAGLEARADLTVGYLAKVTPALGIARGFREGGETSVYFTISAGL